MLFCIAMCSGCTFNMCAQPNGVHDFIYILKNDGQSIVETCPWTFSWVAKNTSTQIGVQYTIRGDVYAERETTERKSKGGQDVQKRTMDMHCDRP